MSSGWRRFAPGPGDLLHAAIALAAVLFLVMPILHIIANHLKLSHVWMRGHFDHLLGLCKFAFVTLMVLIVARLELPERRAKWIALGCLLAFVAGQLWVVTHHRILPYGDFLTQWDTAIEYARDGVGVPNRPQTQRAIPMYYPLVSMFGSSAWVYLLANVVVTTLTYAMTVWIARRAFGWAAAAKTAVLLVFAFEAYLVDTLPSHEVPGAFGAVLFLLLLLELDTALARPQERNRRIATVAGFAIGMGLTIAWTQWVRGTGVFCAFAVLVYAACATVRLRRTAGVRVLASGIALVVGLGTMQTLKARDLVAEPSATHFTAVEMNLLAFSSADSNGKSSDKERKHRLVKVMGPELATRVSTAMFPETLRTGARAKYRNYLDRTGRMLRFGETNLWYFRDGLLVGGTRMAGLEGAYERARKAVSPVWWAILILLGIAAVARRDVVLDPRLTPYLMSVAFVFVMGALAESQGRYAYVLVYLASIYVGSPWLAAPLPLVAPERPQLARGAIAASLVIALAVGAAVIAPRLYGTTLANFEAARVEIAGEPPPAVKVEQSLVTIEGPGAVTITEDVEAKSAGTLRVVLAGDVAPEIAPTTLRISIDGVETARTEVDAWHPTILAEVPAVPEGVHRVTLELTSASDTPTTIGYLGFY